MTNRLTRFAIVAAVVVAGLPASVWGQGTPMPFVAPRFLDSAGNPCSGCLLNVYAAGTSTRQSTYTTVTLTAGTENANPVVMNSAGYPTSGYIYLSATSYRFVLTDSTGGTTYFEADNTPSIPATAFGVDVTSQVAGTALAAGDVVYLSDGSGSLTPGRWYKADADFTYASSVAGMVGIAPTAIASGASGTIRIGGRATGLSGLTTGTIYYISATAGALASTAPTNARFIGSADTTTSLIFSANPTFASVIARAMRINAATPYTLTWPTADAAGFLQSNGSGTLTFGAPSPNVAEGRLTLTSGTPVTTADVSAATSIYYTPFTGDRIALYDGSATWILRSFTEITISITTCTASKPYDLFAYDNAGVVATELLVWTNDTTRATALTRQNGVLVKSGVTTRRYLGSFYCNSSGGQTDDSDLKRYVWNYSNRAKRRLRAVEAADSWSGAGSAIWAQANGSTANQVDAMVGVAEVLLDLKVIGFVSSNNGGAAGVGIGAGGTSAPATGFLGGTMNLQASSIQQEVQGWLTVFPAVGRQYYTWIDFGSASATNTYSGDRGAPTAAQAGLMGWIES